MNVELRKFPYPYRAMLAICSDLDETPDKKVYVESSRFLNTKEDTSIGKGVGLEVGNTIYFDMPKDQFSYWNTDDDGREDVRRLIKSGHIDCLHSFGDFADTREKIELAWNELDKYDCNLKVWVDHARAPTNFDINMMGGGGAIKGSPFYHSDISFSPGKIEYVWKGRVTSVLGQNSKGSFWQCFNRTQFLKSAKTIAIELSKQILARLFNEKYKMHHPNKLYRKAVLADNTNIYEFMRVNTSWGGVSCHDNAEGIGEVLTERFIKRLIQLEAVSILYTHLGKIHCHKEIFNESAKKAFKTLSDFFARKEILVATTYRLLRYNRVRDELDYKVREDNGSTYIDINSSLSEEEIQGLTWYIDSKSNVFVTLNGQILQDISINPEDHTGRKSVSICWKTLEYPKLLTA